MQAAEGIGKARRLQLAQLAALLIGEARRAAVGAGVLQINVLVRDVQIAAEDDRLLGVELLQVAAQVVLPLHAVVDARQLVLGVGHIEVHKVKIRVFQRDGAPLVVVDVLVETVPYRQCGRFRPDGRTGVALFVGAVDIFGVACRCKIRLTGLHLRLLNAEEIRIQRVEGILKALFQAGAQAVDIPADEFHGFSFFTLRHLF